MPPVRFLRATAWIALLAAGTAAAQPGARLRAALGLDDGMPDDRAVAPPAGVQVERDVAYGADPAQRFDVYRPAAAPAAATAATASTTPAAPGTPAPRPIILFVHGGGWQRGDKAMGRVVEPKVGHWVARGWLVVSTNYRMLPVPVEEQAQDVGAALAAVQAHARDWGGDPARVVLVGHSAGAHLVALVAAGKPLRAAPRPIRGAVLLDSAVLDLPRLMAARHFPLYDRAFGRDPAAWPAVSPWHVLAGPSAPLLAVCSSRRADSCDQADRFVARDVSLGAHARVLREDLSHLEINARLGAPSDYTAQVDAFLDGVK